MARMLIRGALRQHEVEAVLGQPAPEATWPFDEGNPFREGVLDAKLERIFGLGKPIKIEMPNGQARHVIDLRKGEGR